MIFKDSKPLADPTEELPQSDQVRMMLRSSLLNKQRGFNFQQRHKTSYWTGMTVGVTVLLAGLLTILATVGGALSIRSWRNQPRLNDASVAGSKRNSDNREDVDNLTLNTKRKLSSVNEKSPFVGRYQCETMPKKMSDVKMSSGNNLTGGEGGNAGGEVKKLWPMSSTLPRSTKLEVHVNRTASIMEMMEDEKKTKQSQAWKEMMKLTSNLECKEDEDEDCVMKSDVSYDSACADQRNNNVFFNDPLKCHAANLPPPPSELLTPHKAPVHPPTRLVAQALSTQMPFDPSPVRDDEEDDISFIDDDDDDDDDVVINDSFNTTNNYVGYSKNPNLYNNNSRFYPIHNNNNNASFNTQLFRQY